MSGCFRLAGLCLPNANTAITLHVLILRRHTGDHCSSVSKNPCVTSLICSGCEETKATVGERGAARVPAHFVEEAVRFRHAVQLVSVLLQKVHVALFGDKLQQLTGEGKRTRLKQIGTPWPASASPSRRRTCSSMSLGRSSCSSMVRMARFISSLDSFSLRDAADVKDNAPFAHGVAAAATSTYRERRMLQFCARRPSMTDSSLTFLEPSVSSSASFCQQNNGG